MQFSRRTTHGRLAPDMFEMMARAAGLALLLALGAADPDSEDPFQAGALGAVTAVKAAGDGAAPHPTSLPRAGRCRWLSGRRCAGR